MLNIYSNGLTLGVPPSAHTKAKTSRTESVGWSDSSTRNNTKFLYSVDSASLTDYGYAFTFTLRDLPATPNDWYLIRNKFIKRCQRAGLIRYHWVTEWQRRGVPHLHGCLYFPKPLDHAALKALKAAWCSCVGKYYALQRGQDIKVIESAVGWLKYLAKHGSRSKGHYQRSAKPKEWASSGRIWGKGGEWPTRHTQHDLADNFYRMRRLVRSWRLADSRKGLDLTDADNKIMARPGDVLYSQIFGINYPRDRKRIRHARRCLMCGDRAKSHVRGMSEWVPERLAFQMVAFLEKGE